MDNKQKFSDKALSEPLQQCNVSGSYYLVRYSGGSYDDYYSAVVFVTNKKSTATKYCTKFNKLLGKWKTYYSQFETNKRGKNSLRYP